MDRFGGAFDPPSQTLYGLVRALAGVNYPDPGGRILACGELEVFDDESLVKFANAEVRPRITEFRLQTSFDSIPEAWFDASDPYRSVGLLYRGLIRPLRAWSGTGPVSLESDRPRWVPAEPGSKNRGTLSFRDRSAPVTTRGKVIAPVLDAFELAGWLTPVPIPSDKIDRSVVQSLNELATRFQIPVKFFLKMDGKKGTCFWRDEPPRHESVGT